MKKIKNLQIFLFILFILFSSCLPARASIHSGKIYLQVEENGEAWYIYPKDDRKYYLGRPDDAFNIMRSKGLGISNTDIAKIPIGLTESTGADSDIDGLSDDLEKAIDLDPFNPDTDDDDFADSTEIENWKNPKGSGDLPRDSSLINRLKGYILLQVEQNGEAWYLNPSDSKRYFLGRPNDAFAIMRNLGIGISNSDLANINKTSESTIENPNQQQAENHYILNYPSQWSIETNNPPKKYRTLTVIDYLKLTPNTGGGYFNVYVLESPSHKALSDLEVSKENFTDKFTTEEFFVDIKPATKQKLQYVKQIEVNDTIFDKGAKEYIDIMINTKKFIHFTMIVYNEEDIARFEGYLDDLIENIKLIY